MRHSLGEPLPHQLADTWQAAPEAPELYPDTNFDIVSLAPHPSQSLYEISMRTRRKFQLLDRLRRYAKVGVRVYSCETISKLMFGTIWDYPVFRRAIPNFGVRSYLLLPRLPVIPYHFYNNRPRATEANMFILTFILIKRFR